MKTLYKKELSFFLNNPIGYIIVILFGLFANFLFIKDVFAVGSASLQPFFALLPWLFLIFIPAVSMRVFSEEKRTNTIETLLTLPISETQIVLAKFLAVLTIITIGVALTLAMPIALGMLTKLYYPEIFVGYLGAIFLGAMYGAIALYFSSLTKNQVIALLSSVVVLFFITIAGTDFLASVLPKSALDVLSYFSPMYHLTTFARGVIDIRAVFYFVSMAALFLFLTIINIEKRD